MIEPFEVIDQLTGDRDLVFRFFAVFSRFEYALKRSGFLKAGAKAEPNWDVFGNSLEGQFAAVTDAAFQDAITFLTKEPPKTQTMSGGQLAWTNTVQGNGERHERYVLRLVNTVRNNLFHGGKYPVPAGPIDDVARNRRLVEAALVVLTECLELSKPVRQFFDETA